SLGESLAHAASLDHLGEHFDNAAARLLGDALDEATTKLLLNRKVPGRLVHELDNRGSQFYLALYWAQALAGQTSDPELATRFVPVAQAMAENETTIVEELNAVQGPPQDLGGYYRPDPDRTSRAMRPSATLNGIIDSI
ncbi:MAG: NADP-dependent isocitrate dehydrogenase, partial [bacterium]|nr:NADP-dependent isocitrate dehydrogenase [bacterium]